MFIFFRSPQNNIFLIIYIVQKFSLTTFKDSLYFVFYCTVWISNVVWKLNTYKRFRTTFYLFRLIFASFINFFLFWRNFIFCIFFFFVNKNICYNKMNTVTGDTKEPSTSSIFFSISGYMLKFLIYFKFFCVCVECKIRNQFHSSNVDVKFSKSCIFKSSL